VNQNLLENYKVIFLHKAFWQIFNKLQRDHL